MNALLPHPRVSEPSPRHRLAEAYNDAKADFYAATYERHGPSEAVEAEAYNAIEELGQTADRIVELTRGFWRKTRRTPAHVPNGPEWSVSEASERIAEVIAETLTEEAAAVLMAAVRRASLHGEA